MENTEIKSGSKVVRNKIVLKNLTRKQKQVLSTVGVIAGGIGLGTGLFTLYSMIDPHIIPGLQTNSVSDDAEKGDGETQQEARSESIVIHTKTPILEIQDENIPFSEAFKSAREINGTGSWFMWKGNIYNTFYKEEWQAMSGSEKDEYLASLSEPNVQEELPLAESSEQPVYDPTSELTDLNNSPEHSVENQAASTEIPVSEASLIPETDDSDTFTLDFLNMEAREPEVSVDSSALSGIAAQPALQNLVEGEFISLDDDIDLKHGDIFEINDDVEISLIPEEDLQSLDSVLIDSDQIISFPWNGSPETAGNEIPDATHVIAGDATEGIQDIDLPQPSSDSAEVEIKPLDHSVEVQDVQLQHNDHEIINSDQPDAADDAKALEETPWGETIGTASDEDAGSLSEIFRKVEENMGKLVSSPDEITEYPWGEAVSDVEAAVEPANAVVSIEELPLVEGHTQPLAGFEDIEEFPWGEQNVHFNPETISTHTETVGELILPETADEHENVGIIVTDDNDPVLYSQLPPSFSDITEFPWGESIVNQPLGQNTNVPDITDSVTDHHIDHPSIDGVE
jgi:hypothetical protein